MVLARPQESYRALHRRSQSAVNRLCPVRRRRSSRRPSNAPLTPYPNDVDPLVPRSRFGMSSPDLPNELKRAQNYRLPTSTIQNISGLPQGLADLIAAVCMSSIGGRQGAALRAWAVALVS